jgi:NADPH:quinone reductase-like Zn-dependent oxidoreductase
MRLTGGYAERVAADARARGWEALAPFGMLGAVRIDISEVLPLERIADAHRDLESRRTTGKIVLDLGSTS